MAVRFIPVIASLLVFLGMFTVVSVGAWLPLTTNSAVGDIFAMIQLWLPFNLATVVNYLFSLLASYYSFKLFRTAWTYIMDITGHN